MTLPAATPQQTKALSRVTREANRARETKARAESQYKTLVRSWRESYRAGVPVTWLARASGVSDPAIHDAIRKLDAKEAAADIAEATPKPRKRKAKA